MNGNEYILTFADIPDDIIHSASDDAAVRKIFRQHRSHRNKMLSIMCCCIVVAAAAIGFGSQGWFGKKPPVERNTFVQQESTSISDDQTTGQTQDRQTTVGKQSTVPGKETKTTQKVYEGAAISDESSGFIAKEDTEKGREKTTSVTKDGSGVGSLRYVRGPHSFVGTLNRMAPKDGIYLPYIYYGSGGTYGGDNNHWMIPATPGATGAKSGIKLTGETITDNEAKAYFEENTWIVSSLSSSGVATDNLKISEKGYCHVSYDGTEGKQLEVRQNFRDYLVYNNGKLVAIITLTKESGKLNATPAFGGPHFDDYNAFLQKHKGKKLLFVYAGWMEMVITPDGEAVNPQGYDMSGYLEGLDNPYEYFYSEAATYTP